MERILTYAEFSKQFDEEGEVLGNTQQDVDALASVTDTLTAPENGGTSELPSSEIGAGSEIISVGAGEIADEAPIKTEVEIITDDVTEEDELEIEELEDEQEAI